MTRSAAPLTRRAGRSPDGESLYWAGLNKGKRSVTLDLRSPEGQRTVADLIASSGPDGGILLTNAGYPWLSYDALRDARPDLIHLRITGGHDGTPAVDYTVNAATGFPLATGHEATAGPVNHVLPAWDVACGLYAAIGILAAERHRRRTGAGRAVTLPLADVALAVTGNLGFLAEGRLSAAARATTTHDPPQRKNFFKNSTTPPDREPLVRWFRERLRTGSGDSVLVVTLTARHYADLARVTGRAEALAAVEQALGADFSSDSDRYAHREVIAALIAPWFAGHSTEEVTGALRAPRCCGSATAPSRSWPPTRTPSPTRWSASSTSQASARYSPRAPRWPSGARPRPRYLPRPSARTRRHPGRTSQKLIIHSDTLAHACVCIPARVLGAASRTNGNATSHRYRRAHRGPARHPAYRPRVRRRGGHPGRLEA